MGKGIDEAELQRRNNRRRTLKMIEAWTAPEGLGLTIGVDHGSHRIDVIVYHWDVKEGARNINYATEAEACHHLDYLANRVMERCVMAYMAREISDADDVVLRMTLAQAGRDFEEAVESSACRGRGGDD